jgi:transposase InsO family protein
LEVPVSATTVFGVGVQLEIDGQRWELAELSGREVVLRDGDGERFRRVALAWLVSHPGLRLLGAENEDAPMVPTAVVLAEADITAAELAARIGDVQEVLTGFRHGSVELALPGEPRPQFGPDTALMGRYEAKAAELGVGVSTVRRWAAAFLRDGPAGLVPVRRDRIGSLGCADPRWVEMCQLVLAEHVPASRPTRAIILAEVGARLAEQYGAEVVPEPSRSTAYELLRELSRGTNAFTGSTKGKRSIADRPQQVYGRLRATRPGEYVLLDTTRLDVFAMEPVTCRWVQVDLTAAMDLYTRCIVGLVLTPVSTKAVDVAAVLYEAVHPRPAVGGGQPLPPHGVPVTVVLDAERLVDVAGRRLLPSVAAETVVYDRGQIYVSEHVRSVCARLGISLQPARSRTPTDKSPLERWFRTLGEGLLVALPGYKGPDVHSRGDQVEQQAFFFLDELEQVTREWVGIYHQRAHRGLCVPQAPGLAMSPLDMFEHGIRRAGMLRMPWRPDAAYDFLTTMWTSIQHYGVEVGGLRYDGPALTGHRNQRSGYRGAHAGKWPIGVDPGDRRTVFFQDPDTRAWHRLDWEHTALLDQPFTSEALDYARRLAVRTQRFPDVTVMLIDLLDRWGAGLTASAAERRMAIRLARQHPLLDLGDDGDEQTAADLSAEVSALPSVRRVAALSTGPPLDPPAGADLAGDDDEADPDPLDPDNDTDTSVVGPGLADFYDDVMDSE